MYRPLCSAQTPRIQQMTSGKMSETNGAILMKPSGQTPSSTIALTKWKHWLRVWDWQQMWRKTLWLNLLNGKAKVNSLNQDCIWQKLQIQLEVFGLYIVPFYDENPPSNAVSCSVNAFYATRIRPTSKRLHGKNWPRLRSGLEDRATRLGRSSHLS